MKKLLSFNSQHAKLLFYSDPHLGHVPKSWTPLFKTRGFNSVEEHDDWFFTQWGKHVDENTIVFGLGDFCFNDADMKRFDRLASQFSKRHYILTGNHFSGMRQSYNARLNELKLNGVVGNSELEDALHSAEVFPLAYKNLVFVGDTFPIFVDNISVYMQHYPQYVWPEQGGGGYCLCGHCHGNAKELNPADATHGRILDVGLDNAISYNQTPFFSWDDIRKIMDKKPVVSHDHH